MKKKAWIGIGLFAVFVFFIAILAIPTYIGKGKTESAIYEEVPKGYYATDVFNEHPNTLEELQHFIHWEFALPRNCERGMFDCSESSAYLEWALEDAGFDAEIATGPCPWNPELGLHAWVIAKTVRYRVAIEATALTGGLGRRILRGLRRFFTGREMGIIYYEDNPTVKRYYSPYNRYDSIYEALQYGSKYEWNWWEGYWGFK